MKVPLLPWAAATAAVTVTLVAATASYSTAGASVPSQTPSVGQIRNAGAAGAVPGAYIVKFRKGAVARVDVGETARQLSRRYDGRISYVYPAIGGFAVRLSEAQARRLAASAQVEYVEQDRVFHALDTQSDPIWGLDRIDQASRPVDHSYTYPAAAGEGVNVYVIDSGIRITHNEFGGRAKNGYDFIDNDSVANDCHGHGTHVAGTIGGSTYGVAKKATLIAVRVLKCDGYTQGDSWLAGMDWVARNAVAPAVANMSVGGGGTSSSIDDAAQAMIDAGVTLAQAAGNEGQDACGQSPGRIPAAITVAASDSSDARSIWSSSASSNYGRCVDLAGPGSNIVSASYSSDTGTATMGGTSMATPHVAGAAALYLSLSGNSGKTPAQVQTAIVDGAVTGKLSGFNSDTPNRLLNISFMNGGTTPPPDPDPDPEPTGCGTATTQNYSGSLSSGGSAVHPSTGSFTTTTSGTFYACLTGPSGTDFDVYLQRSYGGYWFSVAEGSTSSSTESFSYSGSAGTYRWKVDAYSGSGSYTLGTNRPS